MPSYWKFLLFIAATAWPCFSSAQDGTLYKEPPPPDAAFLRWVDPSPAPIVLGLAGIDSEGAAYRAISASEIVGLSEGHFYTAGRAADGEVVIIEEPARLDRSKVYVTVVNLSQSARQLELARDGRRVIGATQTNSAKTRAVNPVTVALNVVGGAGSNAGTFQITLGRGQNVTFVARPDGVVMLQDRFGSNLEK
ncbi:Alginate o-acetyltransferase AlgF [Candidatus Rhodobacter oscarellae]|uniref:Alginate biosynthesis protein AlgF n=1 Tax=Candidatus Rhodobacter oscarellae TaxID=1675527 RepID=A0A0J9GST8_9RHOB|nr:alginate O-acetyltransferase AlgF [Candidatus Rhodobacter lobularis]KMW56568.1 Alginate o-acetyltransferase AlgF [Candidatus Rhodobacter lobularis]